MNDIWYQKKNQLVRVRMDNIDFVVLTIHNTDSIQADIDFCDKNGKSLHNMAYEKVNDAKQMYGYIATELCGRDQSDKQSDYCREFGC